MFSLQKVQKFHEKNTSIKIKTPQHSSKCLNIGCVRKFVPISHHGRIMSKKSPDKIRKNTQHIVFNN